MTNPLFALSLPIPFDRIGAEHVRPAVDLLLRQAHAAIEKIERAPEPLTYETTYGALEAATEGLEVAMSVVEHLESVATTGELRSAYNDVLPEVSAFWSGIPLRPGLYQALKRYSAATHTKTLDPTRRRFLEKTIDEFRRHGAELGSADKERLKQIDQQLSQLTNRFAQNVLDSTNAFELYVEDERRLAGLPSSAIDTARESAQSKGKPGYRFTLQAPSVTSVLTYADDARLRESIWRAYNLRATQERFDNRPLVVEILRLRRDKAKLLGFDNFAELLLVDRMAKTAQEARAFVRDLAERTTDAFNRETESLIAFRRALEGRDAPELAAWDIGYYAEKQRKARFDFDQEALRPYFSAEQVLRGAFETAERLYGVRFEPLEDVPVWDPKVRAFCIVDGDGSRIGLFYVDLYPRENKRDGAWMHGLVSKAPPGLQVGVFCMNGQPPTSDKPSLLNHAEVETVFHEFGHLLHHCLSRVKVRSLSGTRVAQDFVELPSQIMENWCAEKLALDLFAKHYETGEALPQELIDKMRKARTYRAASAQMRQLGFAALDLALHIDFDPDTDGDVVAYSNRILARYAPVAYPREYALVASFSHLFSHPVGYAAGYYSYKWAEVLDADAFGRFKVEGIFNRDTGRQFRERILEKGDSNEAMALFEDFMGRKPKLEPLLEREGLL